MSLAAIQDPYDLMPVVNTIPIVYSSSFSAQSGFRYKVILLNSGATEELTLWIHPDTNNSNYCIYNFNMVLGDLVGTDKDNWDVETFTAAPNSLYNYNFRLIEYIGATSGATTLYKSGGFYVFRGVKQYGDFWSMGDYIPWSGNTATFLSTRQKREYSLTETAVVNTFFGSFGPTTEDADWDRLNISVYNGDFLVEYTISGKTLASPYIYTLPIGPAQLNNISTAGDMVNATTGAPTTGAILDTDDIWYEVYLKNGNDYVSETLRINLDHTCYKHDGVKFVWLGDLSTYEQFTFRMADTKSFKTSKNEIKSDHRHLIGSEWTYAVGDRGRKNINVSTTENHRVISGWIKDKEASDLMELFRSPDVYINIDGSLFPVIITSTSYEEQTVRNNRLFNYTIDFEMAFEKLSNV